MRKRDVDSLVARAGSLKALAALVGKAPSTVKRWLERGVSKGSAAETALKKAREALAAPRDDLAAFNELMRLSGEDFRAMRVQSGERERRTARIVGVEHALGVNERLTDSVKRRIRAWASSLRGRHPRWQIVAKATLFGRGTEHGAPDKGRYPQAQVFRQLPHPRTEDFTLEQPIVTGSSSKKSVIAELEGHLRDIQSEGMYAFIHGVWATNYRKRAEEEARRFETMKRRERSKRRGIGDLARHFHLPELAALLGVKEGTARAWLKGGMPTTRPNVTRLEQVRAEVRAGRWQHLTKSALRKAEQQALARALKTEFEQPSKVEPSKAKPSKAKPSKAKPSKAKPVSLKSLQATYGVEMLAAMLGRSVSTLRKWIRAGMPPTPENMENLAELRREIRKGQWKKYTKKALS